jgi:predicted ATPase
MHLNNLTLHSERFPRIDVYPFNLECLRKTGTLPFDTPVTLFVGENGTGKSTLLKAIAMRCGIHIWRGMDRTRYQHNPHEEALYRFMTVQWANGSVPGAFYASELFRNFAQIVDEWASADPGVLSYFGGSLMSKSHGQSHMSFFEHRFRINGLYLLDEPENALSPKSQLRLLDLLGRTGTEDGSQFIIATHSPLLLACPGATLYSFDDAPIRRVKYEETDHYRIYRDFLDNREDFLRR